MNNIKILLTSLLVAHSSAYAWDFSSKFDFQRNNTDNVNSSKTSVQSDSYTVLTASGIAKTETHKFKLKYKIEKYSITTTNDSTSIDLGYNYKETKTHDYSFNIYQQQYTTTPTIVNDTTNDNQGAKVATSFTKDFNQKQTGYLSFAGNFRRYTNLNGRQDSIFDSAIGLEHYLTEDLLFNPEIDLIYSNSNQSYYKNFNITPLISINWNALSELEFFGNFSYSYTKYSDRPFTTIVRGRSVTNQEHQTLISTDLGAIYTFFKKIPVLLKYSINKNTSNNTDNEYNSNIVSFNIGLKL